MAIHALQAVLFQEGGNPGRGIGNFLLDLFPIEHHRNASIVSRGDATGIEAFTSPAAPGGRALESSAERPCGGAVFSTAEDLDGIGAVGAGAVD